MAARQDVPTSIPNLREGKSVLEPVMALLVQLDDLNVTMRQVAKGQRAQEERLRAIERFVTPRRTAILYQQNRVLSGEQRVILAKGGSGTVQEFTLVSPIQDYAIRVIVDGDDFLPTTKWATLNGQTFNTQLINAAQRAEGSALVLNGVQFTESFEVIVTLASSQKFPLVYGTLEVEDRVRISPAVGLQFTGA